MGIPLKYDYFEERPLNQAASGPRQRNVEAKLAPGSSAGLVSAYSSSQYPWWRTRALEGRAHLSKAEGVWPINHNRVQRYEGDPGEAKCPWDKLPEEWPADCSDHARLLRLHHYFRVWNSAEARDLVSRGIEVRVALEITEDWHAPPEGVIPVPSDHEPVIGSHAIPLNFYEVDGNSFPFINSWGKWGRNGWGKLPAVVLDRYLIEAWCLAGIGTEPPIKARSGLVRLLWKTSADHQEVHGREIVDASSGERLAWAFLVRRGDLLDIEEFYVWPTHRRKGYGRALVELIREFVRSSGLRLRAWVSFADAESENRSALRGILNLLGLHLHSSPTRSAAFLATTEPSPDTLSEPRFPERPASIREKLDPAVGTRLYTVWFGTNRRPIVPDDLSKGFTGERDSEVHYGRCKVSIPPTHQIGSIGTGWWKRWTRWMADDRLDLVELTGLLSDDFWSQIRTTVTGLSSDERQALVFLHGYNVSFKDAAIRAAQLGFDLKVPGITAFFSWPSCGRSVDYPVDENCIESSEQYIAAFLEDFLNNSGAERVHLIAHSMGNRGLLRAMNRIAGRLSERTGVPFGQIILAAPDVDIEVFTELAQVYPRVCQRTTLYASPGDRAVGLSRWIHGYARAGITPPVTIVSGIDTVVVPRVNLVDLWHSYYADAPPILHDVFDLLRRNAEPKDRQGLRLQQRPEDGLPYWEMGS